jgi:hypothetical protein
MLFRCLLVSAALVGCDGSGFPDAPLPDATLFGTVSVAWTLVDTTGAAIPCDQVGARTVGLTLRDQNGIAGVPASFSCGNSPSTTQAIKTGSYNIGFQLNGDGGTIATAMDQVGVQVTAGVTTVADPVTFVVDARGGLTLALRAQAVTSNCKPPAMDGAGITGVTLTMVDARGACAPITFVRSRGGTYTVDCASPPVATCLETDETLGVAAMPSGGYTMHVRGKVGATDCWKNDDALQVPAQGKTLTTTLNLARQPACPP